MKADLFIKCFQINHLSHIPRHDPKRILKAIMSVGSDKAEG